MRATAHNVRALEVKPVADMSLLLLEALGALLIFVFIVWWTMFSGRKGGEPIDPDSESGEATPESSNPSPNAKKTD